MFGRISLWAAGAVLAGLMLPSQAMAQYDAHTRADLNLRVGPGTEYGVIDVIPAGYPVDVLGCLDAYEWCDIEWDGLRGWVSARYLVQPGTTVYLPDYGPRIGVPIISFSFGTYHDRYYRDRPWYRERHGRWTDRDWRDRDDDRDDDRDWGGRDDGDDRDEARDRERGRDRDDDRDEARREAQEREQRREAQEREQQREQRREAQEREQQREQRQQVERQREQRDAERPQQQQREARPQQREARPQQSERAQRQGDRPRQGQGVQRRGNGGPPEELTNERGQ